MPVPYAKMTEEQKARARAAVRRYQAKDPEKHRSRAREASRRLTPQQRKDKSLRHYFGITLEEYNRMLTSQGGVCAVCGLFNKDARCNKCNFAIGQADDSPPRLRNLASYLEKFLE